MGQYKYYTKAQGQMWFSKFRYTDPESGTIQTIVKRGFATKKEAKQYEEEFLDAIGQTEAAKGTVEEFTQVKTFGDVFDEYLSSHKREDIKESTLGTKYNIFEHHIFPTFKDRPVEEITDDDIADWQNEIKALKKPDGKPFSDAYLRTIQSQFNSIINYAHDKGYLKCNPLADIKNMGNKEKRVDFWTSDEYERFAYCAMQEPKYYYCYEVLYWCGMREGEMLALTLKDIDFDEGVIHITKTYQRINGREIISSPKTQSSVRKVSMPGFLMDELKEYIAMRYGLKEDERVFDVNKSALIKNFQTFSQEAGLKKITIHGLRHSHVSLLISKKYDIFEISKRIGHKSVKTTQDIYGHLFDEVQKTIANDLDNLRRG